MVHLQHGVFQIFTANGCATSPEINVDLERGLPLEVDGHIAHVGPDNSSTSQEVESTPCRQQSYMVVGALEVISGKAVLT